MTIDTPDRQDIEQRLKAILDYVRDCVRRVTLGEIMDLQGLDNKVIDLCNDVAALPPSDARALETRMSELIDELEELAEIMRTQQQKIGGSAKR